MINIKIGGVPEHFNLPWHDLIASRRLEAEGVELAWTDYPGGTGAMVADLNAGALDLAVLLTEGAAAGLARGGRFSILSLYTASPLLWGVHVPAASAFLDIDELEGRRFAISREGSGSHLMAYALGRERDWSAEPTFVAVGGLDGAIKAFAEGGADAFLWEKFMTQPVVDAGHFRRIGDFAAPWPAFVVCASASAMRAHEETLDRVVDAALTEAASLKRAADAGGRIAARYGLEPQAAAAWLKSTEWAARTRIRAADVEPAVELLRACGVIDPAASVAVDALGGTSAP